MGRYHPDLDDWAEDVPAQKADGKGSYNLIEKFSIVGVLETITVGVLIAMARTKAVRGLGTKRRLTPMQTNAVVVGCLTLPWFLIAFQRSYYDTLIKWRNVDRKEGSGDPFGLGHNVDLAVWKPKGEGKEVEAALRKQQELDGSTRGR